MCPHPLVQRERLLGGTMTTYVYDETDVSVPGYCIDARRFCDEGQTQC